MEKGTRAVRMQSPFSSEYGCHVTSSFKPLLPRPFHCDGLYLELRAQRNLCPLSCLCQGSVITATEKEIKACLSRKAPLLCKLSKLLLPTAPPTSVMVAVTLIALAIDFSLNLLSSQPSSRDFLDPSKN